MKNFSAQHLLAMAIFGLFLPQLHATSLKVKMLMRSESIKRAFTTTRDICVGRFVLTIPATAQVSYGRFDIPYLTERYPEGAARMDEIIKERRESIEKRKHLIYDELAQPGSRLGEIVDGAVAGQKIFFNLSRLDGSRYALESLVPIGQDVFIQYGDNFAELKDTAEAIAELNQVAQYLKPRADTDIPSYPGFCIDGAIVLNEKTDKVERTQLGIRLAEVPDVHFSIEMTRKRAHDDSDTLEKRMLEAERIAAETGFADWHRRIKTLRRGKRTLPPWEAYEVLARLPAQPNEGESHEFLLSAQGNPNDSHAPNLEIEMMSGVLGNKRGATPPGVSDAEAIVIWERIINSLRLRKLTN
jgi:hypothetical protein